MFTVEDCIETLAGVQKQNGEFKLDRSDYNLITSLARQTHRGVAYTDRQHQLAVGKIFHYKDQFISNGYNIDVAVKNLRLPIREIDRRRWIKISEHPGNNTHKAEDKVLWIAVRFVFQKKLISEIEHIKRTLGDSVFDKVEKTHYFPLNERTVYEIISTFNQSKGFEIEQELKEYYEKLETMANNKEQYLPGIYGLKLKNLHEKNLDYAISSIGEPSLENLHQYYDQKDRFGLYHFDQTDVNSSIRNLTTLSKKIVLRKNSQILVNKKEYTVENLAESVLELYRFPLVIILNEKTCYDELVQYHRAFNGIIPEESCSVMFRLDNADGAEFNQYIKRHNLNNLVDKNTKIVYINNSKIPKPLLKGEWRPITAISNHSGYRGGSSKVDTYVESMDLVMHYDDDVSPWKRKIIEKI